MGEKQMGKMFKHFPGNCELVHFNQHHHRHCRLKLRCSSEAINSSYPSLPSYTNASIVH